MVRRGGGLARCQCLAEPVAGAPQTRWHTTIARERARTHAAQAPAPPPPHPFLLGLRLLGQHRGRGLGKRLRTHASLRALQHFRPRPLPRLLTPRSLRLNCRSLRLHRRFQLHHRLDVAVKLVACTGHHAITVTVTITNTVRLAAATGLHVGRRSALAVAPRASPGPATALLVRPVVPPVPPPVPVPRVIPARSPAAALGAAGCAVVGGGLRACGVGADRGHCGARAGRRRHGTMVPAAATTATPAAPGRPRPRFAHGFSAAGPGRGRTIVTITTTVAVATVPATAAFTTHPCALVAPQPPAARVCLRLAMPPVASRPAVPRVALHTTTSGAATPVTTASVGRPAWMVGRRVVPPAATGAHASVAVGHLAPVAGQVATTAARWPSTMPHRPIAVAVAATSTHHPVLPLRIAFVGV